ncbi:hypothetical protein Hypma_014029 [Hypsizygus marmoreus]|uniref:Large ribosomal subunit protein mL59 domain-containing protein n=1 Tax=Hypsizygus marmoreus TaxID=39966 RepID=A0A369K873_HYPMA|nr:hypothetical protein Hypma_014029 [Hypsizygus marmoreus]
MSALQAVKAFRFKQLKSLPKHIQKFGPLPPPTEPVDSAVAHRLPNPFLPRLNPRTGRWAPAAISLRRQADLVKRAKESNTLFLLPPGPKAPLPTTMSFKEAAVEAQKQFGGKPNRKVTTAYKKELEAVWMNAVEWDGKAEFKDVAGAELGTRLYAAKKRMFKGHRWERLKEARDSKKSILLRDMARRVRNYKAYYQKRKPNPLKTSSSSKQRKLPF